MGQWDSKQFDQKATDIAQAFHTGSGNLHDLTVKLSKDQGLNEEQIRRLGRAVNVKAFEQKFASLKGKADRIVEFDPVDPETVIDDLFQNATVAEKQASAAYPNLPDQMRSARGWADTTMKTASVDIDAEIQKSVPKDPPIESQINHWQKVTDELNVKVAGAEIRWDAAMETLLQHSKRLHWKREEFEKDAIALYGDEVLFEINALRGAVELPALEITKEDAVKLSSHLFGEETEDTKLIKMASEAHASYGTAIKAAAIAKAKVAELTKKVRQ